MGVASSHGESQVKQHVHSLLQIPSQKYQALAFSHDILSLICSFCSKQEIKYLALTCKTWHKRSHEENKVSSWQNHITYKTIFLSTFILLMCDLYYSFFQDTMIQTNFANVSLLTA